jgi:hypothetical protein
MGSIEFNIIRIQIHINPYQCFSYIWSCKTPIQKHEMSIYHQSTTAGRNATFNPVKIAVVLICLCACATAVVCAQAPERVRNRTHSKLVHSVAMPGKTAKQKILVAVRQYGEELPNCLVAPVVSCDVERSFSQFRAILRDNRHNLTFEHLRQYLFIYCNK